MPEEPLKRGSEREEIGAFEESYLSTGELLLEMVKILVLAVVIIIPIRVFFFQPFFVQGSSMEPNFEDGQYLVISELGYKYTAIPLPSSAIDIKPWKELERQEPVVFRYPKNPEQFYIKRIIGLPGESIEIKNSKVIITNKIHPDGYALNESDYLDPSVKTTDMPRVKLTDDEYLVLGDNRPFSYDSRFFGPIKREAVIGRVLLRAWPLSRLSLY
ncbi:MAG: signal peptidase I [Candidatus Moraniibacteriota bacterium]